MNLLLRARRLHAFFEQFSVYDASTRSRSSATRFKPSHFAEQFLKQCAKLDNFVDFRRWQRRAGMQFGPKSRYGGPSRKLSRQLISIKPRAQSINRQKSTFLANSSSESNGNSVRLPRYGKVIAIKRHGSPRPAPSGERIRRCNGQCPNSGGHAL